ncbi:hypothetical protein [Azospirillum rugosum]|uniref:PAS domain-containing protein n=1 Tax=Azospirillum rugosum TaxID=416170 RepID=A0ABS4SQ72_9PROT|nr:hypothetical protein [Azospirillum rugosum]MBP2294704.1 hypothetical protein [Azospirillum rugosum]MDQ0528007.1 hypothetical protein [Azospirillum rugosum]
MSILQFTRQGAAPRPAALDIEAQRLPMHTAADWQRAIIEECRRQRTLTPSVFAYLKTAGLLDRCTFLASEGPADPLRFCYIGAPTLRVLGRAWGRSVLNQPVDLDPHEEFAHRVGAEYAEAMGAGEAVFNRFSVTGLGRPFVYTGAVVGWSEGGRRAVLSAIDVLTIH